MSNPPLFRDPWAKREAWRKHLVFTNRTVSSSMFPRLGIVLIAFIVYVAVYNFYSKAQSGAQQRS
ncbi:NADH dehydrogenase 1 beta subcomplex subunit 3 [Suillus cothurnatus]|nr:NADH dehydrogenase 1 beta subcomplex subunit 3 [Suillus cothurnatus]